MCLAMGVGAVGKAASVEIITDVLVLPCALAQHLVRGS
ncbi:hypothetical protein SIAM614_18014 [Roseibium aggregatum IAM 12614]|uniref:Uncharacterized protein n=1 Tax=Roseibium aggregatum (strain ATCC 25650 / DSM 13394 / JCM 20685 / NBRC 16684 / NCIMB 2208 / IAM 12614 / B1) TaxID=384765 RepID=A0NP83_ROSAI|nr:hypothetical protein SIAM614_18014 [Roseibium aggregatum IAM 12614]